MHVAARDLFWKVRTDVRAGDTELARRAGAFPYFAEIESRLDRDVVIGGRRVLMFGSNNYLGLANDERVIGAAHDAVNRYGTGCTGSRLMNGTLDLHLALEAELADWLGRESALVFTAGYLANLATVATLCHAGDVVVGDARNHASIVDGARLSAAKTATVRHGDMDQLRAKLARLEADGAGALVVWDAIFSMEGDVAPLGEVVEAARHRGARTLIDEAHSIGVLGPEGAGMSAALGLSPDLVMGTFSKALASCGGFVAGDTDVIEYLRLHARPFLFTASGVPAAVGAALAAVRICREEPWRAERTLQLADALGRTLADQGFDVEHGGGAIVAVRVADEWKALLAWRRLMEAGVYVNVGVFPAVPRGDAVLRLSTTSSHEPTDIERCAEAFGRIVDLR